MKPYSFGSYSNHVLTSFTCKLFYCLIVFPFTGILCFESPEVCEGPGGCVSCIPKPSYGQTPKATENYENEKNAWETIEISSVWPPAAGKRLESSKFSRKFRKVLNCFRTF